MTDTVTRLMALAGTWADATADVVDPINSREELDDALDRAKNARQALHDELVRLFTPLSDEQIQEAATLAVKRKELNWAGFSEDGYGVYTIPVLSVSHMKLIRIAEKAHGIGGES